MTKKQCVKCRWFEGTTASKVINTRYDPAQMIFRQRICKRCRSKISTYELSKERLMELEQKEKALSELAQKLWAVLSSNGVVADKLVYLDAINVVQQQETDNGLCIVAQGVVDKLNDQ